jgi:hypothetical protein
MRAKKAAKPRSRQGVSLPLRLGVSAALVLSARVAAAECVETASGEGRPQMVDTFPTRGTSGYVATLHVVVSHGKGETVLPRGLELQAESDTAKALQAAGFAFPDQDGGGAAHVSSVDVDAQKGRRQTTLDLPLLALPSEPGRHTLTLPPLAVSVARANNDVVTICTKPHTIVVDDPTASTPNAQPKPNAPPRPQREEWVALERALSWGAAGVLVGGALAWLVYRWLKRPKPVPPPPPPRPPWEVALERLDEARHAGLLETQRLAEFYDRVNDAVRQYLGARFGFDGLESTTAETLKALRRAPHFGLPLPEVAAFLQDCDLVKFADMTPTVEECERALVQAERIVRTTMPAQASAAPFVQEARA